MNRYLKPLVVLFILIASALGFAYISARRQGHEGYLLVPTGPYGVGYTDLYLTNPGLCPDALYKAGVNDADFSPENAAHCHEFNLRVTYPSATKSNPGDPYYKPVLARDIKYWLSKNSLPTTHADNLSELYQVPTYTSAKAPLATQGRYPVLVFAPGSGVAVQAYNNIMNHLASHGYIVVGLNSAFASGATELANGHVVVPPYQYDDATRLQNKADLKYVLSHLNELPWSEGLRSQMDFSMVGLLGHSMGGMTLVTLLKENNMPEVKASLVMDPGNVLGKANYPINVPDKPLLVMWASKFRSILQGEVQPAASTYELILSPQRTNLDHSNHLDFTDLSTLATHPAIKDSALHAWLSDPKGMGIGLNDGYKLARQINSYTLRFFDYYLRGKKNTPVCQPSDSSMVASCPP